MTIRELHGLSGSNMYGIWVGIKQRCFNKGNQFYAEYGGRGITMCDRWAERYMAFHEDMSPRPDGATIERLDNNRGYEPGNCVWASRKAQSRNRRGRHRLTIDGETKIMAEWSEISGVSIRTIWYRVDSGWPEKEAVFLKVGGRGFGPKPKSTAAARGVEIDQREHA